MKEKFHIKRLYSYILTSFIPAFLMTFAICLFIVLLQFLWKYVEDFVGKGLGLDVIGEMFFYAALSLIPLALPLSILLASLMVFGNMGESLELLAIKSAGIPLLKMMKPLIVLITFISVGAFFFQNNALPVINSKFYSLLISIRQASPELDIPEGVFYKEIDGYNIYVDKKDPNTGMLYGVMIYDLASGFNNMAVIVCDSAKMNMTDDKKMLIFTMYSGQQFQNYNQGTSIRRDQEFVPYARESFDEKVMMVSFDANFERMDASVIEGSATSNYVAKNIRQLTTSIDSMTSIVDSVNAVDRDLMKNHSYLSFRNSYPKESKDSIINSPHVETGVVIIKPDSLLDSKTLYEKQTILQNAYNKADNNSSEYLFRSMNKTTAQRTINRHWVEWHRKFTIPFTCLLFFFIGAPLGSIVRKGGLGTPVVISVIMFIIYYILENVGYKMTRDGVWVHWFGMWFSSFALLPIGVFLTYKAMTDSVIMSGETYQNFFKKLFFIREKRRYPVKSVVIDFPDYDNIMDSFDRLSSDIDAFLNRYRPLRYKTFWLDEDYSVELRRLKVTLDDILNDLSNSRKSYELGKAEEFPVIITDGKPIKSGSTLSKIFMYFFPIGVLFRLLYVPFERRINGDLRTVKKLIGEMEYVLKNYEHGRKNNTGLD